MARKQTQAPKCDAPGCESSAPVSLTDRLGTVNLCYGHDGNGITAVREAMAAAEVSA